MSFDIGGVEIYSLEEISKKLGVDVDSLKKCAKKGDLVARKVGDTFFVTEQNLLAFLQAPAPSPARKAATPKAAAEKPEKAPPKPKAKEVTEVAKPITVLPSELPPAPGETPASEKPTAEFKSVAPPPTPAPRVDPIEERRQAALLATKRRQEAARGAGTPLPTRGVPGNGAPVVHKTLLESDEMPVPLIEDIPGASKPPDTRISVAASKPPTRSFEDLVGTEVAPLQDIPDMFGPESPTLVLRPELSELREESSEDSLKDLAQQGRVARKERDDIITRIRKLPLEDQTKAISGPEGTKLMQLDKIIEEGQKAEHALGVTPEPITGPQTPLPHSAPPVEGAAPFVEVPPSAEARADKEPPPPEATEAEARVLAPAGGTSWVPAGKPEEKPVDVAAFEFDLISRPPEPAPPSPALDAKGGESWHEVGMPSPVGAPVDYQLKRGHMERAEKVTLSFTEEERKLLTDLKIAEASAAHEIMEKFAPANEKAWEYAKHRYFQPLRMRQISW